MSKKQTAVEWLMENLHTSPDPFAKAKAMEKEQHETSYKKGFELRSYIHDSIYGGVEYWEKEPKRFEDYYKETYES